MTRVPADAEVLRAEEASDLVTSEQNPITAALLKNAHFWFTKKFFEERKRPIADYDYAFFMEVLSSLFSEHQVLRRILAGEKVGEFFDDDAESPLRVEVDSSRPHEIVLHGPLDVTTLPKLQRVFLSHLAAFESVVTLNCSYVTNLDNEWALVLLVCFVQQAQHKVPDIQVLGVEPETLSHFGVVAPGTSNSNEFWRTLLARMTSEARFP